METILTIGRQFGSGGREIGEILAEHYGIRCYDKELLSRAAKESGFCQEMIQTHDERPTNSFLYNLVMDTYSFGYNSSSFVDMPISQKVFLAQFDTIKKIASEGPCIIVGRCADYALQDRPNVLNLFIHADLEDRIERVMTRFPDLKSTDKARDLIAKKDKQRHSYYNYYTSKKWGRSESYDLSLNSAILGIEGTVKMIEDFVGAFEKNGGKRRILADHD